jgi:hypothetical protein
MPVVGEKIIWDGCTKLAWFPGVVLIYHSISFWFWAGNRRRLGHQFMADSMRIGWFVANFITGALSILVALNAKG